MNREQLKKEKIIRKELLRIEKEEAKLVQAAQKAKPSGWKQELENRIPEKVYAGLEAAFAKGFSLVFQQGRGIIEKTYSKSDLEADHAIRDFAVQRKGGRKELRRLQSGAQQGSLRNLAVTTVEGIGLGALGIGVPDIVLFLGTLLKGVYDLWICLRHSPGADVDFETAVHFPVIRRFLGRRKRPGGGNAHVGSRVDHPRGSEPADQADCFCFCCGYAVPVVGILGGAANPVYYRKVMKYVQLKYRKRYLLQLLEGGRE